MSALVPYAMAAAAQGAFGETAVAVGTAAATTYAVYETALTVINTTGAIVSTIGDTMDIERAVPSAGFRTAPTYQPYKPPKAGTRDRSDISVSRRPSISRPGLTDDSASLAITPAFPNVNVINNPRTYNPGHRARAFYDGVDPHLNIPSKKKSKSSKRTGTKKKLVQTLVKLLK